MTEFDIPTKHDDFYQCGYAQFILGNTELANYDHARSGRKEAYE